MGRKLIALVAVVTMALAIPAGAEDHGLDVSIVGSTGGSGAEISTFDPMSSRLFVTTGDSDIGVEVYEVDDQGDLTFVRTLPLGAVTSVDSRQGIVAAAVSANPKTDSGSVVFVDAETLEVTHTVIVGSLPDMVTFTPDGKHVLTANEGEPDDYATGEVDPEGSISVISLRGPNGQPTPAREARFTRFNAKIDELKNAGVRIFGPGATVAQDLEPEYIAISGDSTTAYVTLQENNALAVVDIAATRVIDILPLGYKDYSLGANAIDASNADGIDGNFQTYDSVVGMYQPDAIVWWDGYLFTANEGDARDYDGYSEEERVSDDGAANAEYPLDDAFDPGVLDEGVLGRLNTTTASGDTDGDGDFDVIHSYGARSMSVWSAVSGALVHDTGKTTEEAVLLNGTWVDGRSDDKGSEPEGVNVGVVDGTPYVFLGLERTSDIVIFDASDPTNPEIVQLITAPDGAVSPEGLEFVSAGDSPTGRALLIVTYEVSRTIVVFELG